jgi:hypothetical protein
MLLHGSPAAVVSISIEGIIGSRKRKAGDSDLRPHGGVLEMWRFSPVNESKYFTEVATRGWG